MKTIIIYASNHGTTQDVAIRISKEIRSQNIQIVNVKEAIKLDLSSYEMILLGCSIHAGNVQPSMKKFCKNHLSELLQKQIGLFICCLNTEELDKNRAVAFPEKLTNHAFTFKFMGGEYRIEKMNYFEKLILKKIVGVTESQSLLNNQAIEEFISDCNQKQN